MTPTNGTAARPRGDERVVVNNFFINQPDEEIEKYRGLYVVWSMDGRKVLASGNTSEELRKDIEARASIRKPAFTTESNPGRRGYGWVFWKRSSWSGRPKVTHRERVRVSGSGSNAAPVGSAAPVLDERRPTRVPAVHHRRGRSTGSPPCWPVSLGTASS